MIQVRNNEKQKTYFVEVPMVSCKKKWIDHPNIEMRLCPDIDKIPPEYFRIKGQYGTYQERISFASQAFKCEDSER